MIPEDTKGNIVDIEVLMALSKLRRVQLFSGPYVRLIGKHEAAIAGIYYTFAELLPAARDFWLGLARDEETHLELSKSISEGQKQGRLAFKKPAFSVSHLMDAIGWAAQSASYYARNGITMLEALDVASRIEKSMIELKFFDTLDEVDPETESVFDQLRQATLGHLACVEREAAKGKWKIAGRTRAKPLPQGVAVKSPLDSAGDPLLSIKTAQGAVLGGIIAMEEGASVLYNTYGSLLPEHAEFWEKIGAEEMEHASMLRSLEELVEQGNLFRNIGRLSMKDIEKDMDFILNAETSAKTSPPTPIDAVTVALRVESMMAESAFYRTVESDAPQYRYIAERMIGVIKEHIARLHEEFRRCSPPPKPHVEPPEPPEE